MGPPHLSTGKEQSSLVVWSPKLVDQDETFTQAMRDRRDSGAAYQNLQLECLFVESFTFAFHLYISSAGGHGQP